MITVHLILNAHLDPIWLWPWQAGLDEALATCRSACDRLDAHPDTIFTRGEAWVYQMVEATDPALFERIRRHVAAGRWEIVGGWWIQPDCNLPSGWALGRQIALGKRYFEERFGVFPRIAYNVDSFGHAATLPGLMRAAGQDRYVFMRPQEHEMPLPARLFRWRGYEDGPEVVTFRIAGAYTTRELTERHIHKALTELPEGIAHTMCFVGVGDHGGGPTEAQIAWCREHEHAFEGCRLVFSSPTRFFEAVAARTDALPLVTGELQYHAIGCYSVYRPVKTGVRRAEHRLRQAEILDPEADLEAAWRYVCFHHFHDTLGGTCLPSAYRQVEDQLGYAAAVADETLQIGLRRRMNDLPDDPLQRIVLCNASDAPFEDWVEFEPWTEWLYGVTWQPGWRLLDENGDAVAYQCIQPEALLARPTRLLFPARLDPNQIRALRIDRQSDGGGNAAPFAARVGVTGGDALHSDSGAGRTPEGLRFGDAPLALPLPRLEMIEDTSDTWSHDIDRYAEEASARAEWEPARVIENGPLMASLLQTGRVGRSDLRAEWRVYAGAPPFVELRLGVHWREKHRVLKLVLALPEPATGRRDGIPGGWLERPLTGRESPLRDAMLLDAAGSAAGRWGIACPDVFAADATPERVRLTLLRGAVMGHHVPFPVSSPHAVVADQGEHTFRFRFFGGPGIDTALLDAHARMLQRPPLAADLTRGMKRLPSG